MDKCPSEGEVSGLGLGLLSLGVCVLLLCCDGGVVRCGMVGGGEGTAHVGGQYRVCMCVVCRETTAEARCCSAISRRCCSALCVCVVCVCV